MNEKTDEKIIIKRSDSPRERCYNLMRFAGFGNPNRTGAVNSMATLMYEYMKIDGVIEQKPISSIKNPFHHQVK